MVQMGATHRDVAEGALARLDHVRDGAHDEEGDEKRGQHELCVADACLVQLLIKGIDDRERLMPEVAVTHRRGVHGPGL